MSYSQLNDAEFARRAHLELDPLVTTDLERELLARFERQLVDAPLLSALLDGGLDTLEDVRRLVVLHDDYGHLPIVELLSVLGEFDIDTADVLRRLLERGRRLSSLADDVVGPLSQLQQALTAEE